MGKSNTSKIGDELVENVIDELIEQGIDPAGIKKTKGSGNVHGENDIVVKVPALGNLTISIDCKYLSSAPKDGELEKCIKQAKQTGREFGVIVKNSHSKIIDLKVEMRIRDFIRLIRSVGSETETQLLQ